MEEMILTSSLILYSERNSPTTASVNASCVTDASNLHRLHTGDGTEGTPFVTIFSWVYKDTLALINPNTSERKWHFSYTHI